MKKIILMLIAVLGILFIIPDAFAVELPNEYPVGGIETTYDSIMIGEVYYNAHGVMGLGDAVLTPSLNTYRNDIVTNAVEFKSAYYVTFTRDVNIHLRDTVNDDLILDVRSAVFVFDYYKSYSNFRVYAYYFDSLGVMIFNESYTGLNVVFEPITYVISDTTYEQGYNDAKREYGFYDGTDYIIADEWGDKRYNDGLGQNRNFYGYLYNGNWLTAEQWGDIRYYAGLDDGQDNEIDWWSWSTTFFLMPFRILNIEILPGIRIGYFALFSLLLGVVGWFFFIVGKGGGRRK